jgi:hypothetical protein
MSPIRIKRLAAELQMRRRRLGVYQRADTWPGKDVAWRSELVRYDRYLLLAAEMLEVSLPEPPPLVPLPPEIRATVEDRLGAAGLDVFAPPHDSPGDVFADGDSIF